MTLKKSYLVEIIAVLCFIFLIAYMIFTWKNLTPETEGSSAEIVSVEDPLEGVDL